jgi:transposase
MAQSRTLCIGMEVHKDAIAVAYVAQEHGAEGTSLGTLGTRQGDSAPLLRKRQSKATQLIFVYAAGPCGYGLCRSLTQKGYECWVVAPSLMPKKPADRVTTDRRDTVPLARLARSGARTVVSVPTGEEEAIRDLTRAREEAISDGKDAKCRRTAFVLRQDSRYVGRANGNPAHLRWLSAVVGPTPAPPMVLQADVRAVPEHTARLQRLAPALPDQVQSWRWSPVVAALQALRRVQWTVAGTRVAEMGDFTRLEPPRELMKCLGLVPSDSPSAARRRQGAMTTAGNPPARRALGEGAWASRSPATVSRHLQRRLAQQPKMLQAMSGTAQVRLWTRSRRLGAQGKHATVVTGARARELAGGMGAIAAQVPVSASVRRTHRHCTPTSAGFRRASAEAQPRCGVTLDGVPARWTHLFV